MGIGKIVSTKIDCWICLQCIAVKVAIFCQNQSGGRAEFLIQIYGFPHSIASE